MMENKSKKETYEQLLLQIEALISGETNEVGVQANVAAALKEALDLFWVGFYNVRKAQGAPREEGFLALGPFQGSVACFRIPYNKGVCGTAWARRETVVVPDVEQFPGHIACSSLSRSEIVVPVFGQDGEVTCVIDIDSPELNSFDDTDRHYLELLARLLTENLYAG